ncbi:MAG: TSUP family transporter [Polyangiales bacterium]
MSPAVVAALAAAAFVAGTVDAIAGGGGLITLPALLAAGLPPDLALGTNKGQSTFGSGSALAHFWRAGAVDRGRAPVAFAAAFVGALAGARLVLALPREALRPVVLALLVAVAAALAFRPDLAEVKDGRVAPHATLRAALIAGAIGCYDGFFGPGTGTFAIMAYVAWLYDPMAGASANAKVVNFASNLAALAIFVQRGVVRWEVALPMAAAQFAGGALGARLTVKRGGPFVRRVVLMVVVALVVKLAADLAR